MAQAAPKLGPYEYVLESDRESEKKTVFTLRPLNGLELLHAGELHRNGTLSESYQYTLKRALLGWSGFKDEQGKEIPFVISEIENLNRLTLQQASELAGNILERSQLDEDERKN